VTAIKLEVGPGYAKKKNGYAFNPYYCPGHDVIYLDIHPPQFKCESAWIVAHALPLRDEAIDEIYAGHVIEHLEEPIAFLKECKRALKRGGRVTLVTPNFLSKNARADPSHKHVFDFVELWRMVRMAGLTPHFPNPNVGTLLPKGLMLFLKAILYLISDNLTVMGEKA